MYLKTLPKQAPPQRLLPVVEKAKGLYKSWIQIHRDMAKTERFGIGTRIDSLCLELLEALRKATYAKSESKIALLSEAILKADALRFFLQLAWEASLIANTKYISLGKEVEEVGRMIGGWKRGLESKTPPKKSGERKE